MSGAGNQSNQQGDGAGKGASLGGNLMDVPKARLVVVESPQLDGPMPNGGVVTLTPGSEQVIGRDAGCSFAVPSRKLSRQHARIFGGVGAWGIEDLNSTNGVLVNKQRVTTAWLKQGDEIRLGPVAFRYELEAPPVPEGATVAMTTAMTQARGPLPADDDGGERTMMIGSLSASKAVIDAARKSEPKQAPAAAAPPVRPKAEPVKAPRQPLNVKKFVLFGVLAAILAAGGVTGAVWWPKYQKEQAMAEVAASGARVARIVVARVRDHVGPGIGDGRFDEDVAAIRPALDRTWEVLVSYPEEASLAEIYARLRFLSFERSFAGALAKDDYAEAARMAHDAQGRLMGIERDLPATADPSQKRELAAAIELLDFAGLLVEFRAFARKHPQVNATATDMPTKEQMLAFDQKRDQFIKLRRTHNKVLSIDYLLFNRIVQEVENRDLSLINHWREFLTARGGGGG